MAWGQPSTASAWKDLNAREWAFLVLPAVLVLYIGLNPGFVFKIVDPSVNQLLDDFNKRKVAHVDTERPMQTAANDIFDVLAGKK